MFLNTDAEKKMTKDMTRGVSCLFEINMFFFSSLIGSSMTELTKVHYFQHRLSDATNIIDSPVPLTLIVRCQHSPQKTQLYRTIT